MAHRNSHGNVKRREKALLDSLENFRQMPWSPLVLPTQKMLALPLDCTAVNSVCYDKGCEKC